MFSIVKRWLGLTDKAGVVVPAPGRDKLVPSAGGHVPAAVPTSDKPAALPSNAIPAIVVDVNARTVGPGILPRGSDLAAPAEHRLPGLTRREPIGSWACQLQDIDPAGIAGLNVDLAVVDHAADGTAGTMFSAADVRVNRH